MPSEKALALVLRTTDWSETSRIATLWTREFGKVRALAKGGRRLKSSFESALDLLTVCSIVFLRKSSGSLDLLTEAQVVRRFPRLRTDLAALYAAYYVAESLNDWTEDYDPHPLLFDEALDALDDLGTEPPAGTTMPVGLRVMRFEMVLLRELGYSPALEVCAVCETPRRSRRGWRSARRPAAWLCPGVSAAPARATDVVAGRLAVVAGVGRAGRRRGTARGRTACGRKFGRCWANT